MIKRFPIYLFFAFLLFGTTSGCQNRKSEPARQSETEAPATLIQVSAATDLQPWIGDALTRWAAANHPELQIQTSYGASGAIAAQVRAGAPIDLFLSADTKIVEKLSGEGHTTPDGVRPYARGSLALLYQSKLKIKDWKEVTNAEIKHLVIANPATAPYGIAAKSALEKAGLLPQLETRLVVAESVRQAMQQVVDGNAEAGIVALGHAEDAATFASGVSYIELPETAHTPIVQGMAVIRHPEQTEAQRASAALIMQWILSNDADQVFIEHGLKRSLTNSESD